MKEELKRAFQDAREITDQDQELAAIWLSKPVMTLTGKSCRIEAGEYVSIHEGRLVDLSEKATHIVEACSGSMHSNHKLHVRDLNTGEQSVILL